MGSLRRDESMARRNNTGRNRAHLGRSCRFAWRIMAFRSTIFATVFGLTVTASFGGEPNSLPIESAEESAWEYTISTSVYIVRNEREFVNPTVSADHDWLHMEARYNYEAINTGSAWVGWN